MGYVSFREGTCMFGFRGSYIQHLPSSGEFQTACLLKVGKDVGHESHRSGTYHTNNLETHGIVLFH